MAGRRPKPVALHRLKGTFQAVRHAAREEAEPKPVNAMPSEPPTWLALPDLAARIWTLTHPHLPSSTVGAGDVGLMSGYCILFAHMLEATWAQARLDRNQAMPFLIRSREGNPVLSQYVRMIRQSTLALVALGNDLGLSPAARARIGAAASRPADVPPHDPADPWAQFEVVEGGRA
jgi:phage terminase small subunit